MNIKKVDLQNTKNVQVKKITPELIDFLIKTKIQQMFAEVDPQYLKKLSSLVNRELTACKDTEDYNMDLVSEVVDKAIRVFMDAGQDSIKPGDYIQMEDKITSKIQKNNLEQEFLKSAETGDYNIYPYTAQVESEIRSMFLLQTNKKDTFKNLMQEFETLVHNFMDSKESDILKKCIEKSEKRIFQNSLLFPAPIEGNEQGVLRQLTAKEIKEYNLQFAINIDERFDNHDLLSLKDLILMMSGKKTHPLAFGPSFFAKYMPEIKEAGFEGVVLVVEDGVLKSIKLATLPEGGIRYSPVAAATVAFFNFIATYKMTKASANSINDYESDILTYNPKKLQNNIKLYIVVDGCISIPSDKTPYTYEGSSKNNKRLMAGEVFVLESIEQKQVLTRLGFVPYDYSQLHIFHQHGSVVLGSNDQSMQSCYNDENDFAEEVVDDYKDYWKKIVESGENSGDAFNPSVIAARIHYFFKNKEGKDSNSADIFEKENEKALELAMHSISEINGFTLAWTLNNLHYYHMAYTGTVFLDIKKMIENYAPLSRRWLAKKYLENGSGITIERQPTFYVKIAEDFKQAKMLKNIDFYLKMKTIEQKVSEGISHSEAIAQVYEAEVSEELKKLN